jgi:predicted nucleic acid-binding protein
VLLDAVVTARSTLMAILFDTSVWIRHFRSPEPELVSALEEDTVFIHEAVIGELAVGRIPKPKSTINDLLRLPFAPTVPFRELLDLLMKRNLVSKGLSWVDVQLIGSCLAGDLDLSTYDLTLAAAWKTIRRR